MEIKMPELEYGHIISHTFPGILLTFEIVLTFSLFTNINIFNTICSIDYKAINILFLFIILFVCSTIFGIIVDCVHHFLFYHWEAKSENNSFELYEYISSMEQLQILKLAVTKDYWYYYECYANLGIAMMPGILLYPYWLYIDKGVGKLFIAIFIIIYLCIIYVLIKEALSTLNMVDVIESNLLKNFKNKRQ